VICFLLGVWETLWHRTAISGHDFVQDVVNDCGCVEVLRCLRCDYKSVGWR